MAKIFPHRVPFDEFGCDKYGYFNVPLEILPYLEFLGYGLDHLLHGCDSLSALKTGATMWNSRFSSQGYFAAALVWDQHNLFQVHVQSQHTAQK